MKKIVMYCRLSNERDLARPSENDESIQTDETVIEEDDSMCLNKIE